MTEQEQEQEQTEQKAKSVDEQMADAQKARGKAKRDIFHFNGERPTAINLEHVTHMVLEGKKITFNFYSNAIFVELADSAAADSVFKALLTAWSADAG